MPIFRGKRVNRTNGAGAGRGDQPYERFNPPSRIRIDSGRSAPMPPRDTEVARKANRPTTKDKALKKINKNPLTPADNPWSRTGFKPSEASTAYDTARYAESRLTEDKYRPLPNTSAEKFKESDQDVVGSYIATGKSSYTDEGRKWVAEKGSGAKKKRDEEYG